MAEKAGFPIRFMAKQLGVSTSGFYDRVKTSDQPLTALGRQRQAH